MLKIKDNIDLKELEKFGFVYKYDEWRMLHTNITILGDNYGESSRGICDLWDEEDFDILFDLIQAGLVEKVVE